MDEKRTGRKCDRRDFLRKVAAGGALASTFGAPALAGEGPALGSVAAVETSTPAIGVGHGVPAFRRRRGVPGGGWLTSRCGRATPTRGSMP